MLHIITPLYRFENLELIYNSILSNDDIMWHISKSNKREELKNDFIKKDKRIVLYNLNVDDHAMGKKRSDVLKKINSGYFCFLDDDTIFHENMYIKYKECEEHNFIGMLIGEQLTNNNKTRLIAHPPKHGLIDVGNVLSHTKCLKNCEWPIKPWSGNDYLFWESVYNFYGKKCGIWNQPISYYNKLKPNKK